MTSTTKTLTINNVVSGDKLKEIQLSILQQLSSFLSQSFGPYGSTTCIKKLNALNKYTKDGHNILCNIQYNGIIEQSIKDDIESITQHIVKTVGDGTTSSVLLASRIFKEFLSSATTNVSPAVLLRTFDKIVDDICDSINSNAKACTVDDIYNIAMISSNGDEKIATNIKSIYESYGMGVFIDVSISNSSDDKIKVYDGVTLEAGFADPCYINDSEHNTAVLRDAHIYVFDNPVDTAEMGVLFDSIIAHNIMTPLNNNPEDIIPTVIICPRISRDASAIIESLVDQYSNVKPSQRPPFALITDYNDFDTLSDISKLCGVKFIRKYIDPKNQQMDIESGKAPTPETIHTWCGLAEEVVVSSSKTKFINPAKMLNEDGSKSQVYLSLVDFLSKELSIAEQDGENASKTGRIKRRLNALSANLVEYLVGGITIADRDAARDLIEDSVKNCRSAAAHGVGSAANFEAYKVITNNYIITEDTGSLESEILRVLNMAYRELITDLYKVSGLENMVTESLSHLKPVNLRDPKSSGEEVVSSIESDIIILKAVSQIIGIMFTTNQFIVPTPAHNIYL